MVTTVIAPDLIQAYRSAHYGVQADPPFEFTVGQASAELRQLMAQYRCQSAIYLTACNPFSRVTDPAENAMRQENLARELLQRGLVFVPGCGQGSNWAAEPSYWVPFLSLESGKALGQQFEQNAIVWCGPDAVPELVLLR